MRENLTNRRGRRLWRLPARLVAFAAMFFAATAAWAVDASDRYRSPRNAERKVRKSTELIVLHTTEAPAKSSLAKLSDRGEAHYCVTEDGTVYRIVDRDKVAFHAGRSMWKGVEDVDKFSIGIECVGYHDKAMDTAQLKAIKALVAELKAMYGLSDDKVVCHGHVAYGAPNKWHRYKHRGRKRCGMLFAMPSVRRQLGLATRVAGDPDVKARRLRNPDEYLAKVLYGNVDPMRSTYRDAPKAAAPRRTGGILGWLGIGGSSEPKEGASGACAPQKPPPKPKPAAAPPRSVAELRARGFAQLGTVARGMTASKIAGGKWNAPDTYYTIRNKVFPGNAIDPGRIEVGMAVWRKK